MTSEISLGLASAKILAVRVAGVRELSAERNLAPVPHTWGEAMEVPEMVLVAEGEPIQAEVMAEPGPKRSTQSP